MNKNEIILFPISARLKNKSVLHLVQEAEQLMQLHEQIIKGLEDIRKYTLLLGFAEAKLARCIDEKIQLFKRLGV